jgi:AraC family transcriptional regulator
MDRAVTHHEPGRSTHQARVILSSRGRGWRGLEAEFLRIPPGLTHVPGSSSHRLGNHFGRSVNADCRCDGQRHRRVQKHGDIDIVPAGLEGSWEDDAACNILRLQVSPALLRDAAIDLGRNPDGAAVAPRFQLRDPQIEAIAWAIKTELEATAPSDRLYAEALGTALAIRLVEVGSRSLRAGAGGPALSARQRRLLVDFIETHLDQSLSLTELATVAGLSVSHLKTLFRNTFGMPVHQYVVRCRVEHARALLLSGDMPMSRIALEAGFADQSHMATCMRRVLGLTPGAIARMRW